MADSGAGRQGPNGSQVPQPTDPTESCVSPTRPDTQILYLCICGKATPSDWNNIIARLSVIRAVGIVSSGCGCCLWSM